MEDLEREKFKRRIDEKKTPLEYKGFEKYFIGTNDHEGQQWVFKFDNGYGASIIKHWGSYGFEDDLFELAVLYFEEDFKTLKSNKWHLTYDTSITDNVIGYLTNNDVLRYLLKIQRLDKNDR